jgi:hypothetical protein
MISPMPITAATASAPPRSMAGARWGPWLLPDDPIFSFQRPVRALLTLPAYDHSGNEWFFTVLGGLSNQGFTADSAGQRARQIANAAPEYIFPKKGTDPVGLGAMRQSVILDMRNGYFSNNVLGLWIHVWISYTDRAFNTAAGRQTVADLARRNGRDLDGTAIIKTASEIDDLFRKGLITKTLRPLADPLRYAICPVIKDPTDGGIAPDQFLAITRKPDGTPLEPQFLADLREPADDGGSCRLGRFPARAARSPAPGSPPPPGGSAAPAPSGSRPTRHDQAVQP